RARQGSPRAGLAEERLRRLVPGVRDELELGGRLGKRHRDDLVAVQRRHATPASGLNEIRGLEPEAQAEDAVTRWGGAASLDVAEHGRARLHPGPALELLGDGLADGAVLHAGMPEFVHLTRILDTRQLCALAGDDHREVLAARAAALHRCGSVVEAHRLLGDE